MATDRGRRSTMRAKAIGSLIDITGETLRGRIVVNRPVVNRKTTRNVTSGLSGDAKTLREEAAMASRREMLSLVYSTRKMQ